MCFAKISLCVLPQIYVSLSLSVLNSVKLPSKCVFKDVVVVAVRSFAIPYVHVS